MQKDKFFNKYATDFLRLTFFLSYRIIKPTYHRSILMEQEIGHKKKSGPRILRTAMPNSSRSTTKHVADEEDQFLKLIQRHSQELVIIITKEGKVKYCGPSLKSILGYDSFRLLGNNIRSIIPVNQWVAFRAAIRASDEKAEESISIDCQLIDAEEKRQFFTLSFRDYRQRAQIEGYVVYATKIDRLKRQESKLKLRNLAIELIKEAVVIIEPKRKSFLFANKAFYTLSGFNAQEIMGGKLKLFRLPYSEMLFDPKTNPKLKERFFRAIRKQVKFTGRIYSRRKNGTIFYNRFSLLPVFDSENQLTHYIATLKEIKPRSRSANLSQF